MHYLHAYHSPHNLHWLWTLEFIHYLFCRSCVTKLKFAVVPQLALGQLPDDLFPHKDTGIERSVSFSLSQQSSWAKPELGVCWYSPHWWSFPACLVVPCKGESLSHSSALAEEKHYEVWGLDPLWSCYDWYFFMPPFTKHFPSSPGQKRVSDYCKFPGPWNEVLAVWCMVRLG